MSQKIKQMMAMKTKPISSVSKENRVIKSVSRSSLIELNKTIEPKIRQNEQERNASMNAAAKCVVGGKLY